MAGELKYRWNFLLSLSRRRFLCALSALIIFPASNILFRLTAGARATEPNTDDPSPRVLHRLRRRPTDGFAPFPDFAQTGRYGIGTNPFGPTELLDAALDTGVSLVDTSPDYNDGETERRVGRALGPAPGPVFVMTQIPRAAWDAEDVENACHQALQHSLNRLGRARVEALLIRNAEPKQIQNPGFRAFAQRAKRKGWVGRIGASGHGPDLEKILQLALTDDLLEIILFGAHLARFQSIPDLLPQVRRVGKLLVAMKTREAGLWNQIEGWEMEAVRRRHAPWNGEWDPDFTRRSLRTVMAETAAHNAVLSLQRPGDISLIRGDE